MGYLAQVFTSMNNVATGAFQRRHLPMLNQLSTSYGTYLAAYGQVRKKKQLMTWFKGIPELTALASKVAKDIVYKWHFEPVNPDESGRNKTMKANRFAQEVGLRKLMLAQVIDMLAVGEGYGWMGKLTKKQVETTIKKVMDLQFLTKIERKEVEKKVEEGFINLNAIDEDLLKPRKYRYIPSTTMEIIYDQYDIKHYMQYVGIQQEKFMPNEIVHYTLTDVDGRVTGFTPVEAIIVQLELLRQMWQNMLSIHKNGGIPDKIFSFENIKPSDPAFERVKAELKKYKLVENKHGNMVFTGKVTVQDLQQLDKMQFMDSGLYITGLVAMQWQIPRSSIPYIVQGTVTKDDTGGNSEKGYWRNIEFAQMIYAETMNTQLWMPHFGVKIVFDNTYIQQDVQHQTAMQLKYFNIMNMDKILSKDKKQLKGNKRLKLLDLTEADIEEMKEMEQENMAGADNQLSDQQVEDTTEKRNIAERRRSEQTSTIESRGMKPTGVGKEKKKWTYDFLEP